MIQIQKVTPDDADQLLELGIKTFFDAFYHLNDPDDYNAYTSIAFTRKKIISEIQNPNSIFYFAMADGAPIGYLKINIGEAQTEHRDKNYVEVERIYVLANWQGKGVGEQLLKFAIDLAREGGYEAIWLGVWQPNTGARRFYQRHGFSDFGSHEFVLGKQVQTDVLMKMEL